jgi:hypothetical protein
MRVKGEWGRGKERVKGKWGRGKGRRRCGRTRVIHWTALVLSRSIVARREMLCRLGFNKPATVVGGIRLRWRWGYFGNSRELA